MNDLVREVFVVVIGVTIAFVLYVLFFGMNDISGMAINDGNLPDDWRAYKAGGKIWNGVIWDITDNLDFYVSRYYYEYCYLPQIHANDEIDKELGLTVYDAQSTPSDLSSNGKLSCGAAIGVNGSNKVFENWY